MDRYPYHWYTILLGATRALAHIGVYFTHHVFGNEFKNEAYENARIYKEKTKAWYDKHITRTEFTVGQQVLLFNSHLKLFPGKLKSRWSGPFTVTKVFSHGGVEVTHPKKGTFTVTTQRLNPYFGGEFLTDKQIIPLTASDEV